MNCDNDGVGAVDPIFVTFERAGQMLGGLSARSVRRMVDRGELRSQHLGRRHVIAVDELRRLAGAST